MTISEKAKVTTERLEKFMDKHVYPNNVTYHQQIEDFGDNRCLLYTSPSPRD